MATVVCGRVLPVGISSALDSTITTRRPLPSFTGLRPARLPGTPSARRLHHSAPRGRTSHEGGRRPLVVSSERKPWDIGRFLQTVLYFNEPPKLDDLISRVTSLFNPSPASMEKQQPPPTMPGSEGVVLVVGATGGLGKRVVDELRLKGLAVRALVRDLDKAERLLGKATDGLQFVAADISQRQTLLPEYFTGVQAVINCAAVIVGPQDDTPDRQKYYQGIKFYDPVIKGDTPEAVEFRGVSNVVDAVKGHLGLRNGRTLFTIGANGVPVGPAWGALDDVVMGGVSASNFQVDRRGGEEGGPVGLFKGVVSTDNSGGFASIRTKNFPVPEDLTPYDGLAIRVKGTGKRYKLILRTTTDWDAIGYTASFDTTEGAWQTVTVPFSSFVPVFRARTVTNCPPLDRANVVSLQIMYSKFEYDGALNPSFQPGPFELPIASITAILKEPITPRFVHVGSAGVTRPGRPGLDLSKQPPAVRMNDMLGGILTYKLKGEDAIRDSGVPFTIVRPCALTEEPAGADLQFDQGDNITGKIGREEIALICVACLESPEALDKTFEVKSTVPFSQPFTVDPDNPPPRRDYAPFLKDLKEGVTGKLEEEQTASVVPV